MVLDFAYFVLLRKPAKRTNEIFIGNIDDVKRDKWHFFVNICEFFSAYH